VSELRLDDARGRHTTSRRHLIHLGSFGLILDTPGMREFALLDDVGLATSFADVESAAATCRFSDCAHRSEPGCGVRAAIASGALSVERLEAFGKLERQAAAAVRRVDAIARIEERRKWKAIHKSVREHMKQRYGGTR
jgi:ribosome biogenesis GTPase / thiamine phosphate phosphatase